MLTKDELARMSDGFKDGVWQAGTTWLMEALPDVLGHLSDQKEIPKAIWLDSSTERKFSKHAIFPDIIIDCPRLSGSSLAYDASAYIIVMIRSILLERARHAHRPDTPLHRFMLLALKIQNYKGSSSWSIPEEEAGVLLADPRLSDMDRGLSDPSQQLLVQLLPCLRNVSLLDTAVYNQNQNFRLPDCCKLVGVGTNGQVQYGQPMRFQGSVGQPEAHPRQKLCDWRDGLVTWHSSHTEFLTRWGRGRVLRYQSTLGPLANAAIREMQQTFFEELQETLTVPLECQKCSEILFTTWSAQLGPYISGALPADAKVHGQQRRQQQQQQRPDIRRAYNYHLWQGKKRSWATVPWLIWFDACGAPTTLRELGSNVLVHCPECDCITNVSGEVVPDGMLNPSAMSWVVVQGGSEGVYCFNCDIMFWQRSKESRTRILHDNPSSFLQLPAGANLASVLPNASLIGPGSRRFMAICAGTGYGKTTWFKEAIRPAQRVYGHAVATSTKWIIIIYRRSLCSNMVQLLRDQQFISYDGLDLSLVNPDDYPRLVICLPSLSKLRHLLDWSGSGQWWNLCLDEWGQSCAMTACKAILEHRRMLAVSCTYQIRSIHSCQDIVTVDNSADNNKGW